MGSGTGRDDRRGGHVKPPICELCGDRFDPDSGALLEFERTPSDADWHRRSATGDVVGHPPNVAWFCADHADRARGLTDHTLIDALEEMVE